MSDSDPTATDGSPYRRTIQGTTYRTVDPDVVASTADAGDDSGLANDLASATADRSRRQFLAAMGAGAGATALGLGNGTAAAHHDEREMPEEFSDRGIPTPWLHRDGNLIKDPDGNTVKLRGVNVCDPARAEALHYRSPLWQNIAHATDPERDWYSRIIRIPVQTGDIVNVDPDDGSLLGDPDGDEVDPGEFTREQLEAYLEAYLRPAVEFCERMGVYAIVEYHRHEDQSVYYTDEDLHEEVMMFWDVIAPAFADDSHVIYEVYNEPIRPFHGQEQDVDGGVFDDEAEETWLTWREAAQPWVDKIREYADRNLIVIGSPRWSQWTWWAPKHEFEGENLAYAAHVYTHENLRPLEEYFGEPAEEVPVFVSEFGWDYDTNADFLNGTAEEHGPEFREFMESYDSIHWQAWCFDPFWQPVMFDFVDSTHEWDLVGAPQQGEFIREWLQETRDDMIPGHDDGTDENPCEEYEADGEQLANDEWVCDLDGDGNYRDLTASGDTTTQDLQYFFENQHKEPYDSRVDLFDFTGNDDVGQPDVVDLFHEL